MLAQKQEGKVQGAALFWWVLGGGGFFPSFF